MGDKTVESNYRPVSILPIYERLLYFQINSYMVEKLSIYQGGFTTKFNDQYCRIRMMERCCFSIDEKGYTGALFTDLTKAIDLFFFR